MLPLKPILNDALRFFTRNLRQIFTLCMPFLLAGAVMNYLIVGNGDIGTFSSDKFFITLAVNAALYPLYTGSLILMMAGQAANKIPTNTELISAALTIYLPMLLLGFITHALMLLGFSLLILPGIWVSVRLAFCEFFLVLDRVDPQAAIVRSFQTTRPHFFLILTALALIALPVFMLMILTGNLLFSIHAPAFVQIGVEALIAFAALFLEVVKFRIFMETRTGQDRDSARP